MASASPFSGYLNTNYVPSPQEIEEITTLIGDRLETTQEMQHQMDDLRGKIFMLKAQLSQHEKYVKEHRALISVFRRIPDDVLGIIFLVTRGQRHFHFPAITISHVCRRWRSCVLSTPLMWADISIQLAKFPILQGMTESSLENMPKENQRIHQEKVTRWKERNQAMLERVSAYIHRSGTRGLRIFFRGHSQLQSIGAEERNQLLEDLVKVLRTTTRRWKSLDIEFSLRDSSSPFTRLLQIPASEMGAMQSLTLANRDHSRLFALSNPQAESPESTLGALKAVSLTALTITDVSPHVAPTNVALPVAWSNLTFLCFRSSPGSHNELQSHNAIPILASCTNLLHCTLAFRRPPVPIGRIREVTLHKLQVLELSDSEHSTKGLASLLNLPSLTTLSTVFKNPTPLNIHDSAICEFLSRYGEQLLDVELGYIALKHSALIHALSLIPNAVRLKMVGHSSRFHDYRLSQQPDATTPSALITDEVLARLTPSLADGVDAPVCSCPKLRRLECRMGPMECSEEAFTKLILRRYGDGTAQMRGPIRRIEEVVLDYNRDIASSPDIVRDVCVRGDLQHLALKVSYRDSVQMNWEDRVDDFSLPLLISRGPYF